MSKIVTRMLTPDWGMQFAVSALVISASTGLAAYGVAQFLSEYLHQGASYSPMPFLIAPVVMITILPEVVVVMRMGYLSRKTAQSAHHASRTDGLTQLQNRSSFVDDASRAMMTSKTHGALLIVDADHFKRINDIHGHQSGDRALVAIADELTRSVRAGDLLGRLGGEEFGIFLPGADCVQAALVAERVREAIAARDIQSDLMACNFNFTVSVGGACYLDSIQFESVFTIADLSLYSAKAMGRNAVNIDPMPVTNATDLQQALKTAVDRGSGLPAIASLGRG